MREMLTRNRRSASALIDLSKVLFPELVCLRVLSSPDHHLSKRAHEGHQSILRDDLEVLL